MKVSEAFAGFLEAEDLPQNKDIKVVIRSVRESTNKDKGQDGKNLDKPIVAIEGAKKEWVLNKTNAKTIRRAYGNDMSKWAGMSITIYRTTCNAFGKTVACVRVREEMNNEV